MKENVLKYIFLTLSFLLLVILVIQSRDAGISCDEVLHYEHSLDVYDYFASRGADQSALNTPESNLKYYGQSYDNIVTIVTKWLGIEDVYTFRNMASALAGWLVIVITALFAAWLSGYGTAIIVVVLFAISPTFIGHSYNNLKDIPFALGYIASIYFSLRLVFTNGRLKPADIAGSVLSLAFAISIRSGGLLLICYLYTFLIIRVLLVFLKKDASSWNYLVRLVLVTILISGSAYFLSLLLWPFGLEDPLGSVISSYRIMAHYPLTFRQIFEGTNQWSDFMPWYYLPKSMVITIPIVVITGLLLSFVALRRINRLHMVLIYFTLVFPVIFVILQMSNLYSSWRQFLFLYPVIILLSATGFHEILRIVRGKIYRAASVIVFLLLLIHPVRYIIENHPYEYIYYNQLTGGLKGAHTRYETDYYFTGQTEAARWLKDYLRKNDIDSAIVAATFSVDWHFRDSKGIKTEYLRNEERSMHDWDYAIITNRYIPLHQLSTGLWPPDEAIYIVHADSVPLCAVLKRKTKDDLYGYRALESGGFDEAISLFKRALAVNDNDEMIFYNFARALYSSGNKSEGDSVLMEGLKLNPDFELILKYLGNIAAYEGRNDEAIKYYSEVIRLNIKSYDTYVKLASVTAGHNRDEAINILRGCLKINPAFTPAIKALADIYRDTDPGRAADYDKILDKHISN